MIKDKKISVVTVCFNAVDVIEKTILSIINQTYKDLEYIIIDGASTDGTLDIINRYKDKIACLVSEPDEGIYDAMNKGIMVATGEWINFMNAGDEFFDNSVLSTLISSLGNEDIIYGDTMLSFSIGKKLRKPYPLNEIEYKMVFGHQATFVRTEYHKKHMFDTFLKSSADFKFLRSAYLEGRSFKYVPLTIVNYDAENGYSIKNRKLAAREDAIILGIENNLIWKISYVLFSIQLFVKTIIKEKLPKCMVNVLSKRNIGRSL